MAKGTWYKIDNVSKVFLATVNERDTRSLRISCTLKESVDPQILQEAAELATKDRAQLQISINRGMFWYYLEQTSDLPKVHEENDRPCPMLTGERFFGKLHFLITYYKNRINLDISHVIADGTGALDFLNVIVNHYLRLKYPEEYQSNSMVTGASEGERAQDSFEHFHSKQQGLSRFVSSVRSYQLKGNRHLDKQLQFMEVHLSVSEILAKAKSCGVSLTSYIGATLMQSIAQNMPERKKNLPITISLPVNLRNYYNSNTSRNFFNSVNVSHLFLEDISIEELAKEFNDNFKSQLTPEMVKSKMDNYQKIENIWFVKITPLFIKNIVVNLMTKKNMKCVTATLSSMGVVSVPEEAKEYIRGYSFMCSTEGLFITCATYNDDLVLGISYAFRETQLLRDFIKNLSNGGSVTLYATEIIE